MIPIPEKMVYKEDYFVLSKETSIFIDQKLKKEGEFFLREILNLKREMLKKVSSKDEKNCILLEIDKELSQLGSEGYRLIIDNDKIQLTSSNPQGLFYAIQSLRQLFPPESEIKAFDGDAVWEIPCVEIEDKPRFKWRGIMLDVSRHFQEISTIKRLLDLMVLMKMNVFHWHLTDDQGWRIEIEKYPNLIRKGSKRKDTKIGSHLGKKYRGKPHEGFYTKEEIEDIIEYAQDRFITIIPEIEMPGHVTAAIASYPELSCRKKNLDVAIKPGIFFDILCAGQDYTYQFLENVLNEIIPLFSSDIIHIGGDEAPKKRWKECNQCQLKMTEEDIENTHSLHHYFTDKITAFLKSKGKITMGWNEILHDKIDREVIIQWWKLNKKQVMKHLQENGKVVLSRFFRYYFDYNYFVTPLRKTYSFEPIPRKLKKRYHHNILGVEATIWTEWIPTIKRLEWQVFPRFFALAETGWSQKPNKNYKDFKKRLIVLSRRLDVLGINYASIEEVDPSNWVRFKNMKKAFKWPEI